MHTEYLYLTPAPAWEEVQSLLAQPWNGVLAAQQGTDALGTQRCTLKLQASSREAVAALRQGVLAECRARGWKAVVV